MTETVLSLLNQTIQKALEFADKKGTRKRREDNPEWSCSEAGKFLVQSDGTIDWKGHKACDFGYSSIWEYCAGEFFGEGKKAMEKADYANQLAPHMENGFRRLKERLFTDHGLVLLVLPRQVNTQKIQVITLDPTYEVTKDPLTGGTITAGDLQRQRDQKLVTGQMRASHHRLSDLDGPDTSKGMLQQLVEVVTAEPVPLPKSRGIGVEWKALEQQKSAAA